MASLYWYRLMASLSKINVSLLLFVIFFFSTHDSTMVEAKYRTSSKNLTNKVSALIVFGDSYFDTGNNNDFFSIAKSNHKPYGIDFPFQIPTGRFSNGVNLADIIASYLGVTEFVPAYLDKTKDLQTLMAGVNFASAGSGYDQLSGQQSNAILIQKQFEYFKEYKTKLELSMGQIGTQLHLENAVFLINYGTNDIVTTYFYGHRKKQFTIEGYLQFLLQNAMNFFQGLFDLGARRIVVAGLLPTGCTPVLGRSNSVLKKPCLLNLYSNLSSDFNKKLQDGINSMQLEFLKYNGYEFTDIACCGLGFTDVGLFCNFLSKICTDRSQFVYFDNFHPTQKTYQILFNAIRGVIDLMIPT
ncbi:hypothetical protein AQUCO_05100085v1 [Aquilegia coerulea]|uniref:SGNH hydrolase-type esterase domain-containing protein n=1 Tax=Aquilegia coerulea TaxID=218851 RepID=A0A2G5CJ44_AQUCA|nr:hypothetical protein AQUCO_05100085v1 [Aquilegia coerulea]